LKKCIGEKLKQKKKKEEKKKKKKEEEKEDDESEGRPCIKCKVTTDKCICSTTSGITEIQM
jgi:hypothetical protein